VTLACDEDQLQAHKVILSACSPFFRTVLKRNRHEHPLLYMKGVRYTDLQSVLNFMYHGEVNIAQEHLNSFLTVAEELQVKGLTQKNKPESKSRGNYVNKQREQHRPEGFHVDPTETQDDEIQEVAAVKTEPGPAVAAAVPESGVVAHYQDQQEYGEEEYAETEYGYEDTGAYDEAQGGALPDNSQDDSLTKLKLSLMQKVAMSDGRSVWECVQCGKTHHNKSNIMQHVDLHIQGATYTCHFCQKQFKSQGSLNVHTTTKHRDAKRMEKLNANLNY